MMDMVNQEPTIEKHEQTPVGIGIPVEIACNYDLTQTEKILFGYIQNLSKKSGGCWASNRYLGKIVGVGEQSITNSLRSLQNYMYINIELEKSTRGISRKIFINPNYLTIYKPLVEIFYDNLNLLDAEPFIKKLYRCIKEIMLHHNKNYTIREYKENSLVTSSKDEGKVETLPIDDNKTIPKVKINRPSPPPPKTTTLTPNEFDDLQGYTKEAKGLLTYWNNLSKPIPHHRLDTHSRTFVKALNNADRYLNKGYSVGQIKDAMDTYLRVITLEHPNYPGCKGMVVGLDDFFEVNGFLKDAPIIAKLGIKSWLVECLRPWDEIEKKFSRQYQDKYPDVTERLKMTWPGERKEFTLNEENILRKTAERVYNYFIDLKDFKDDVTYNPRHPASCAPFVWKVLSEKGNFDFGKVPNWIQTDTFFIENVGPYLTDIGYIQRGWEAEAIRFSTQQKNIARQQREQEEERGRESLTAADFF
jgi:hypothetical protein